MKKLALMLIALACISPAFATPAQPQNDADQATAATGAPSSGPRAKDANSQAPQNDPSAPAPRHVMHRKHHRMHHRKPTPPAAAQNTPADDAPAKP